MRCADPHIAGRHFGPAHNKGEPMTGPAGCDQRKQVPTNAVSLMSVPFDRTTIADLRTQLRGHGVENGLADLALSNFVLAVNEIVTNSIRHGGGRGQLELWRHGSDLWCQVSDTGNGIPHGQTDGFHQPPPGRIGGWGIWLASHICTDFSIETGRTGTRTWMRYAIPPAPAP
jgi:serine/threonine-protein kinase RsbW